MNIENQGTASDKQGHDIVEAEGRLYEHGDIQEEGARKL